MAIDESIIRHIAGGLGVPQQALLAALQQIGLEISAQTEVVSPAPTGFATLVGGAFLIYVADNKLKAAGPDGTVTDIANP